MAVRLNYCNVNIKKIDVTEVIKYCLVIVSELLLIDITCCFTNWHVLMSDGKHFETNGTLIPTCSHTWHITTAGEAAMWLSCLNLAVVKDSPTRKQGDGSTSKLDLIIKPEQARRLSAANTSPVGFSDHWLLKAQRNRLHHQHLV